MPFPVEMVVGPIEARIPEIVARVSSNISAAPSHEPMIFGAVEAAIIFAIDRTNRTAVGLPDDPLTVSGLVGFSERIYLDSFSPNGAQVAVADAAFGAIFTPENLWKHWRHYFMPLKVAWGIS